jgi:hypothetical protein
VHCFEVLYGDDPKALCPPSQAVYDALVTCICGPTCGSACGANLCQQASADSACDMCIASVASGCGNELIACNNDF